MDSAEKMSSRIQEWFDKMVRGLANQNWFQALTFGGDRCTYRGPNHMACAIGQIIPDNAPCIASNRAIISMNEFNRTQDLGLGEISKEEINFLIDAQAAHDEDWERGKMKSNFIKLGKKNNLTWPQEIPQ